MHSVDSDITPVSNAYSVHRMDGPRIVSALCATVTGIEPATSTVTGWRALHCSTQPKTKKTFSTFLHWCFHCIIRTQKTQAEQRGLEPQTFYSPDRLAVGALTSRVFAPDKNKKNNLSKILLVQQRIITTEWLTMPTLPDRNRGCWCDSMKGGGDGDTPTSVANRIRFCSSATTGRQQQYALRKTRKRCFSLLV